MDKQTKICLIIAASLVVVGCIVFGGAMAMLKWDFTKLSTLEYETNEYVLDKDYKNIKITTDTADIVLIPSEGSNSTVVCYEQKNVKHTVSVEDDTVVIQAVDTRKWYEYIGIAFSNTRITVCIPQGQYSALSVKSSTGKVEISKDFTFEAIEISNSTGDVTNYASTSGMVKIKTSTGKICTENISAGSLELSVSTGEIAATDVRCEGDIKINVSTGRTNITDVACNNLISVGNTGDMTLDNVIAADKISIDRSTGDVKLDSCDAAEIFIKTDTGDVKGSLLTDKVFITQTDSGSVDVPKTTSGGKCEIITDTGSIKITVLRETKA